MVYQELRKLAAAKLSKEKPGQTLQPTMLVHEAYLRLVDRDQSQCWNERGHFFAAAAEAMRRILVENARRKRSQKYGREMPRLDLSSAAAERHWKFARAWLHSQLKTPASTGNSRIPRRN